MEETYGRCDAIRMQDTSGEISGPRSREHANAIAVQSPRRVCRAVSAGQAAAFPADFVSLKLLFQAGKEETRVGERASFLLTAASQLSVLDVDHQPCSPNLCSLLESVNPVSFLAGMTWTWNRPLNREENPVCTVLLKHTMQR